MIMNPKKTTIVMKKGVKLNKPILLVGLPGIGSVGKLVAEHLRREFKAKKFATLYSPYLPDRVKMLKDGTVQISNNSFYLLKAGKASKNDIVILSGDAQGLSSKGRYQINTKIVDFFKEKLNGSFIYTIGGYNGGGDTFIKEPKVFGSATSKRVVSQFKSSGVVFGETKGFIMGSAGLIVAFAKVRKIDAICLMGETSLLDVDASAAKAVLLVLAKCLNLQFDMRRLDKIIEGTAKFVRELERQASVGTQLEKFHKEPEGHPSYIR
jgi:hypothetical protein